MGKLIDDLYVKIKDKRTKKKKTKASSVLSPNHSSKNYQSSQSSILPSSPSPSPPSMLPSSRSSYDVLGLMSSKVKLIGDLNVVHMIDVWDTCESHLASALDCRDTSDIIKSSISYMTVLHECIRLLNNNNDNNNNNNNNDSNDDQSYEGDDTLDDIKDALELCLQSSDVLNDDDISMKLFGLILTNLLLALCLTIQKEKERLVEYKSIMIAKDILDRRQVSSLSLEIDRLKDTNDELLDHNEYLTSVNDRMRQQQIEDFEMIQQRLSKSMSDERDQKLSSMPLHHTVEHLSRYTVQDMIDNQYNDDELQSMEYELRVVLKRVSRARDEIEKKKEANSNTDTNNVCCVCLVGRKTILLMPCRHLCLCDSCNTRINDRCPMCNSCITHSITVYS